MACIDKDDAAFGALEVVVFEVGGDVDVGLCREGVGDEGGAAAAAEGDFGDCVNV